MNTKLSNTKGFLKETIFHHTQASFSELADFVLQQAYTLGATSSDVMLAESVATELSVRMGNLETVENSADKSLVITVYIGHQSGSASTADFSSEALKKVVHSAYDIARFTTTDPYAGLPAVEDLASSGETKRDLDIFHPWNPSVKEAFDLAMQVEQAALQEDQRIKNSEGATVSALQSHFLYAQMQGKEYVFSAGYPSSHHSLSVVPIAIDAAGEMQRDYWSSSMCCMQDMESAESIGRYAAQRALARLGTRKLPTQVCPVLFEAPVAAGLLGALTQALSGGSLYRKTSFLVDSLGKNIFPEYIEVIEDPFMLKAKGSVPFDGEGVDVKRRKVVAQGQIQGYFLNSYTARKLQMQTTGNAGGSHNLLLYSLLTQPEDDLKAMCKKLHRGLLVTELIGQGVNYVTGDYSRGVSGFWVENGEIVYPVSEITIAGNLQQMFLNMVAIGADTHTYGKKTTGSVLIEAMQVAGEG
jgi:PmbA protein